ncbi:uncharacterized protein A1O9_03796 [Exophiala aquamarina CBS 119918]|uniref:Uncharacterized protein n=1 Tax=Exophiala aquamarina CBS 119918 TaxID=1182545 RepID=A0A072PI11_9EURO|nr:uncharacterized protein A1O9_03796 [Exophiala aquamarina CBS 119918]KEF58953.1 hypothetical protein A1O9_03796 [Exophiala aquamarina CBS 119918]
MKSRHKRKKAKRRSGNRDNDKNQADSTETSCDGWPLVLSARRDISLSTENQSWMQSRVRLGEDDSDDTYQIFMRGPSDPFGRIPIAVKLEELCSGTSLESLREAEHNEDGSVRLVAWRDDRNFETKSAIPSTCCKPLTAYGLFLDLRRHRFPSAVFDTFGTGCGLDADRRLTFIIDLDRYSIFALVWTAPPHQVPALRRALYNHLNFEPSLEMTASVNILPPFEMAFHLPFFVLRSSKTKRGDHRHYSDGTPLRRSHNVSYINGPTNPASEWLHEAQISCFVTGSDESRWVAHLWVDRYYFDPNDEDEEDVFEYVTDALEDSGMQSDPLLYGIADANKPAWDPRIYFLSAFAPRLAQVRREWERVVMKFRNRIHAFPEALQHDAGNSTTSNLSLENATELDLHAFRSCVLRTKNMTDQLKQCLSKMNKACEPFCSKSGASNGGSLRFPRGHRLMADVHESFDRLCKLEDALNNLAHECGGYKEELDARLALEAHRASDKQLELAAQTMTISSEQHQLSAATLELGKTQSQLSKDALELGKKQSKLSAEALALGEKQSQAAKESKGFSLIMVLYVSPVALTASIFSMQDGVLPRVLPFVRQSPGWFFGLIAIFELLGLIVHTAWNCQWAEVASMTHEYYDDMKHKFQFSRTRSLADDPENDCVTSISQSSV